MYPHILHLYGPLWVNSYGTMIAIGFAVLLFLLVRHPKRAALISTPVLWDCVSVGLAAGILGGRVLYVLESPEVFAGNWLEVLFPWEGGFSLLGTIIAELLVLPWYLRKRGVPILPFLDLVSIYAPLMQAISRVGCFLAGCCYGCVAQTTLPWAVKYFHAESLAPLGVYLHPTQLYSTVASFLIFVLMNWVLQYHLKKPGELLCVYLLLESSARFLVDYWRGEWVAAQSFLGMPLAQQIVSESQILALAIFASASAGLCMIRSRDIAR